MDITEQDLEVMSLLDTVPDIVEALIDFSRYVKKQDKISVVRLDPSPQYRELQPFWFCPDVMRWEREEYPQGNTHEKFAGDLTQHHGAKSRFRIGDVRLLDRDPVNRDSGIVLARFGDKVGFHLDKGYYNYKLIPNVNLGTVPEFGSPAP